ncbi:hypothetical protein [Cochleicola gelatinilyticus]|uniref:Uncharacterized protein n=1 Tax=Cochleicola gelatinilyticus TaxID=1763537 RepID=A0A167HN20_9FLAO|nr:hypothetical protein [Cochleicola gelatinilyticus]OAB78786.1 hypothetical protein ULVI_09395 [Cochleicola gelatinilyticus]
MYEFLKQVAEDNKYPFLYARTDYQNLYNELEQVDTPHIFLDPVQIDESFGDYNEVEETTYIGSFTILVSSDIDEDYDYKYLNHIKPVAKEGAIVIKEALRCEGKFTINNWRETEVVNAFDYNLDGLVIRFNITE